MSGNYLSRLAKKSANRKLAAAVMTSLLVGAYAPGAWAAESYNTPLTGSVTLTDTDVTYSVTNDGAASGASIGVGYQESKTVVITAGNNGQGSISFIGTNNANKGNATSASGFSASADSAGTATVTINGNTFFAAHSGGYAAAGLSAGGEGKVNLTVNGNVTMRDNEKTWAVTAVNNHGGYGPGGWADGAANYTGTRWAPSGISLSAKTAGSSITVNGDVDLAIKGNAVVSDPWYTSDAVINLNGGKINIETPESDSERYYALANYGGTINVNTDGTTAGTNDVTIQGNIITMKGDNSPFYYTGKTNLALTTEASSWTGVVDNSGSNQAGEVNLTLQNGATWNHDAVSKTNGLQAQNMPSPSNINYGIYNNTSYINNFTGGVSSVKAGNIYPKDAAAINIANYSGHTNVYYEHSNDGDEATDYEGGKVTISKAAEDSSIALITNNTGIDTTDNDKVGKVFSALAGKLAYTDYINAKENLDAKVQIASGLVASSVTLRTGAILFADNGDGYYGKYTGQLDDNFNSGITGDASGDQGYTDNNVREEIDGVVTYKFDKDTTITTVEGATGIDVQQNMLIDADGHNLTINNTEGTTATSSTSYGIRKENEGTTTITADKLNVSVADDYRAEGIGFRSAGKLDINSDLNLDIKIAEGNKGTAIGVYANAGEVNINGDVVADINGNGGGYTYYGAHAIYATSKMNNSKGAVININGNVDLSGNANGLYANSGGSVLNVNGGGRIEVDKDNTNGYYAINAEDAIVNMNIEKDEDGNIINAGSNDVNIKGNVVASVGAVNGKSDNVYGTLSQVNLGLGTKDSTLEGVFYNQFADGGKEANGVTFTGELNMWLQNGATWTNTQYGTIPSAWGGEAFAGKGSKVTSFVGGKDAASAGNIYQNDSNDLTIQNYSGYTNIYYEHDYDGTNVSDWRAGNTIIVSAVKGSHVTLITDSEGINLNGSNVSTTLNNLAGKLYYTGATNSEDNLTADLKIASGLVSSGVTLRTGVVAFNSSTGQGGLKDNKVVVPEIPTEQEAENFYTAITGDASKDVEYQMGGVLQADGNYKFTKDSSIKTSGGKTIDLNSSDYNINADGKTLNIVNVSTTNNVVGIKREMTSPYGTNIGKNNILADNLVINVEAEGSGYSAGRADGIYIVGAYDQKYKPPLYDDSYSKYNIDNSANLVIKSNVDINVDAHNIAIGLYAGTNSNLTVNGNVEVAIDAHNGENYSAENNQYQYSGAALYASSGVIDRNANIIVNGDVEILGIANEDGKQYGANGNGLQANMGGSVISVNGGGVIEIDKNNTAKYSAIIAEDGIVNMNVKEDTEGNVSADNHDVNIKGNVTIGTGATNGVDKGTISQVNLGLSTKNSTLHGVVYNAFRDEGNEIGGYNFKGESNLWLQNGATWTNEKYGDVIDNTLNGAVQFGTDDIGSKVTNFVGGETEAKAGNIFQNDTNALKIQNYSGYTNIYYAHENTGSNAEDYAAGNTIINNAAEGSQVTLITDSEGINMNDMTAVEATLGALANKLYYSAAAVPESEEGIATLALAEETESTSTQNNNLTGKVQIASGLVTSSVAMYTGDMSFAADKDGQGQFVVGSATSGLVYGDYETEMMKGVRSAMTTSALHWRNVASDIDGINSDNRELEDKQVWAKTYGGKSKYDGSGLDVDSSYWAAQVGYNRSLDNGWTAGVAVDYLDGDSNYEFNGKADESLYAIGIYAKKDMGDKGYLNLAAKFGEVESDFGVHNELGKKLEGDYDARTYSLSAQYGKRFGDAEKGYWEPQAQLTWAHVKGGNFDATCGSQVMHVDQDAFTSLVGRLGIAAGKETDRSRLYAKLSLAHEFAGDIEGRYTAEGITKNTSYDVGDTWSELTLGGEYKLSKTSNFYADITRSLSGDYQHEWKLNAGFNFTF